jgi:ATP phosphoribosyltransferase
VETGASLDANGLEKKLLAFNSSATLVRSNSKRSPTQEALMEVFTQRLEKASIIRPYAASAHTASY